MKQSEHCFYDTTNKSFLKLIQHSICVEANHFFLFRTVSTFIHCIDAILVNVDILCFLVAYILKKKTLKLWFPYTYEHPGSEMKTKCII